MGVRVLHNRVLLKHLEEVRDELWLPDSAGFLQRAVVMEVGAACEYVHRGDVVMFKQDEALKMRVRLEALGLEGSDDASADAEETVFLVPESGVYLVLEAAPVPF